MKQNASSPQHPGAVPSGDGGSFSTAWRRIPSEFAIRYFYSASVVVYFLAAGRVAPGLLPLAGVLSVMAAYLVTVAALQLWSRGGGSQARVSRLLLFFDTVALIAVVPHDPAPSMTLVLLVALAVLDYGLRYGVRLYRQGYAAGMMALAGATILRAICVPDGVTVATVLMLFLCVAAGFYIMLWSNARIDADAAADQARRRTAMAMSATGLGLWENDLRAGTMSMDENTARMHGADPAARCLSYDEVRGLLTIAEVDRVWAAARRAIRERSVYDLEYEVVWPDKSVHSVGSRGQALYDEEGRAMRILGVCWDNTEQRHGREELSDSKRQLALALEATGAGIWMMELATRRVHWDAHTCRIMGVDPEAHQPSFEDFIMRVHPDDRDAAMKAFERAIQQAEIQDVEVRIHRPDGSMRLLRTRGQLAYDEAGKTPTHLMGACWDVTARRGEQDQLRRITERNMRQGNALRVGTWRIDWIARRVQRDADMLEILGLGPEKQEESLDAATQRYHPDDRPRLAALQAQAEASAGELSFEYRMLSRDGGWRMLYSRGRVLRDPQGRMIGMAGATTDVTRLMNAGHGEAVGVPHSNA